MLEAEIARIGTWQGWAGEPDEWPVTEAGRRLVESAVAMHRDFFGDSWLTQMAEMRRHPFLSMYEWPRTGQSALVQFLTRSMRLHLLDRSARGQLAVRARATHEVEDVHHLDLLLEVAGLALRDGWQVAIETPTRLGRKPDLQLGKRSMTYSVEVSRLGTDRNMRRVTDWCRRLDMIKLGVAFDSNVSIGGEADAEAVDHCNLDSLERDLVAAGAAVRADGVVRAVEGIGVRLVVGRQEDSTSPTTFTGPLTVSDPITRLCRRIESKGEQTAGGPPAWIRLDEVGGLFQLSPWSRQPMEQQLHDIDVALSQTIAAIPHIRGLVLSDGTDPWGAHTTESTAGYRGYTALDGPIAMVRKIPIGRSRRTFILPNGGPRVVLPTGLDLAPQNWYDQEAGWLDWALSETGWPPLAHCLQPSGP